MMMTLITRSTRRVITSPLRAILTIINYFTLISDKTAPQRFYGLIIMHDNYASKPSVTAISDVTLIRSSNQNRRSCDIVVAAVTVGGTFLFLDSRHKRRKFIGGRAKFIEIHNASEHHQHRLCRRRTASQFRWPRSH